MSQQFSLQRRLLTRTLGGVLVVWIITAVFVWFEGRDEVEELLDAHLAQSAALLVVQHTSGAQLHDEAQAGFKYASRVAYQVFKNDRLVMHTLNAKDEPLAKHKDGFDTVIRDDQLQWRVYAEQGPSLQVYVAERIDFRDEILYGTLNGFFVPLALGLPLLLLGLWWNVRAVLQPFQKLRRNLSNRGSELLKPVTLDETPLEVQPMVDALNSLLARLAQRIEMERRFTADAAHELRTPIAAIRAQAQVALGAHQNEQVMQAALNATLAGCDRASRVVEQLLTLARVEGPQDLASEPFRLDLLAQQVMADITPDALRRGQILELNAPEALQASGQATLWQILLRNLIDNALRYSPDGAVVRIDAQRLEDGQVQVCVQDSGPGLSSTDAARLGERFFRVLGTSASGSGLGWSIVRHIATLQRIEVQVGKSEDLGGLKVTLIYPQS